MDIDDECHKCGLPKELTLEDITPDGYDWNVINLTEDDDHDPFSEVDMLEYYDDKFDFEKIYNYRSIDYSKTYDRSNKLNRDLFDKFVYNFKHGEVENLVRLNGYTEKKFSDSMDSIHASFKYPAKFENFDFKRFLLDTFGDKVPKYLHFKGDIHTLPHFFFRNTIKDETVKEYLNQIEGIILDFPQLQSIGHNCFYNLPNLKFAVVYTPNLQTIGRGFFENMRDSRKSKLKFINMYCPNLVSTYGNGMSGKVKYFGNLKINPLWNNIATCKNCTMDYYFECNCLDY